MFINSAIAATVTSGTTPSNFAQYLPIIFVCLIFYFILVRPFVTRSKRLKAERIVEAASYSRQSVVIKTYRGKQAVATMLYQTDSARMASLGYAPTSQTWAPGSYGGKDFVVAALLCFIIIGIIIFIYMIIVKPDGVLTVTYELRSPIASLTPQPESVEKTCPQCAEPVRAAALKCRFCGHEFPVT